MSLDNVFAMGGEDAFLDLIKELPSEAAKNRLFKAIAPLLRKEIDLLPKEEQESFVEDHLLDDEQVEKMLESIEKRIELKQRVITRYKGRIQAHKSSESRSSKEIAKLEKFLESSSRRLEKLYEELDEKDKRVGIKIANLEG